MSASLLVGVTGLALLDALNPATIAGVALLLLAPISRPTASAAAFVAGAYLTVLVVGAGLYLGADAAADVVSDVLAWIRRAAILGAAVVLAWTSARHFRARRRPAVTLPAWVGVGAAAPLGVLMTGADLPNAFPYLVAIERLVAAGIDVGPGLAVLAGYALVYCGPCLLMLVAAVLLKDRVRDRLRAVHSRFGAAKDLPARPALGVAGLAAAAAVATVAVVW